MRHPTRGNVPVGGSRNARSGVASTRATSAVLGTSAQSARIPSHVGDHVAGDGGKIVERAHIDLAGWQGDLLLGFAERGREERFIRRVPLAARKCDLPGVAPHPLGTQDKDHVHLAVPLEERREDGARAPDTERRDASRSQRRGGRAAARAGLPP